MLTIYFARHGETPCNLRDVMCGAGCDAELTPRGMEMAQALAAHCKTIHWKSIYSSALQRARTTASTVAQSCGMRVTIDPRWNEIDYGEWDGKSPGELREKDSQFRGFRDDPGSFFTPAGESIRRVSERAMQALDAIRGRHADGPVLVVSHKTTLRLLLCRLLGIDVRHYRSRLAAPSGSMTVVEFDDRGPRLLTLGNREHLPARLRTHQIQ